MEINLSPSSTGEPVRVTLALPPQINALQFAEFIIDLWSRYGGGGPPLEVAGVEVKFRYLKDAEPPLKKQL